MADLPRIAEELSHLTVMEAAELSRMLENRWGVSASAPVVQAAPVTVIQPEAEAQSEFSLILTAIQPDKKINVLKEVRQVTGLGLKESKEFTEDAGPDKLLKDSLTKEDALRLKERLEEAGAIIELR